MKKRLLLILIFVFIAASCSVFAEPEVIKNSDTGVGTDTAGSREVYQDRTKQNGSLIYGMTPVYSSDFAEGTYELEALSSSQFFRITEAELTNAGGSMSAIITLSSTSYAYVYQGSAAEAAVSDRNSWIPADESSGYGRFSLDVQALNKEMPCAAYSKKKQKWYDRDIVFLASGIPEDSMMIELSDEGSGTIADTQEAAMKVIYIALAFIVPGGILNHFIKRKYYE